MKSILQTMADAEYKRFSASLLPTVDPGTIIGVRTPQLRALAKHIRATPQAQKFLNDLPHTYFEENNLHGFLICEMRDFDECLHALQTFLPHIDNWATCDQTRPKALKKDLPRLQSEIYQWMQSPHTYTVRFAIGMLLSLFLEDGTFNSEHLQRVAQLCPSDYYVKMMIAWYFATALAKQYDKALPYLEEHRLSLWIHNKTVSKAIESFRIPPDRKQYLKTLRRQ